MVAEQSEQEKEAARLDPGPTGRKREPLGGHDWTAGARETKEAAVQSTRQGEEEADKAPKNGKDRLQLVGLAIVIALIAWYITFEYFLWGLGLLFISVIAWGIFAGPRHQRELEEKFEAREAAVGANQNFDATDLYLNQKDFTGIAIDLTRDKLLLLRDGAETCVGFEQLISVELFEDSVSLVRTNRGSQLGGVIVGGILAGGVGAVIGGLSGSKRSSKKVRKIVLKFITDDFDDPNHEVTFLPQSLVQSGVKTKIQIYEEALENASLWHSRLTTIMKRQNARSISETEGGMIEHDRLVAVEDNSSSPAEEIKKAWELKEQGIISDEEFEKMKSNIISS